MLHIRWFLVLLQTLLPAASRHHSALQHLRCHKVGLLSFSSMRAHIVGKEKQFQDKKDDEELDKDNQPQRTPQHHVAEAIGVEVVYPVQQTMFLAHLFDSRLALGRTCLHPTYRKNRIFHTITQIIC